MISYLATFYTHHDALTFFGYLKAQKIPAKMMPTPRKVSASCGACVRYTTELAVDFDAHDIEAVYTESAGVYTKIWGNSIS